MRTAGRCRRRYFTTSTHAHICMHVHISHMLPLWHTHTHAHTLAASVITAQCQPQWVIDWSLTTCNCHCQQFDTNNSNSYAHTHAHTHTCAYMSAHLLSCVCVWHSAFTALAALLASLGCRLLQKTPAANSLCECVYACVSVCVCYVCINRAICK